MRAYMTQKLFVLSVMAVIALAATPVLAATATFSSDAEGWGGTASIAWKSSAGSDGNAGWIEIERQRSAPDQDGGYAIAGTAATGGAFRGTLDAVYGNLIRLAWSVKDEDGGAGGGTANRIMEIERSAGGTTLWAPPSITLTQNVWTNVETVFNTNWSDAQAQAAGWFRTWGSASFADTCDEVSTMYFYGNGLNASYYELFGIDSVSISGVPEPSAIILLSCGLVSLLAYAWRRRR